MCLSIRMRTNRSRTSSRAPCNFWLGEKGERELTVRAGEVLVIPSYLPHRALAVEDTLDVDVFNPPRQDWLNGTDAYLRR